MYGRTVRTTLFLTTLALMLALPAAASAARGEMLFVNRADGLAGVAADNSSFATSISADGRFVSFESVASNLSSAANASFINVFLRDTQAGTTTLVSQNDLVGADNHSFGHGLSADGRFVAFASVADNLSDEDNEDFYDIFLRDTQGGTTTLVSRNGPGGDERSLDPSISADGRFVAFASDADNLSTGDENGFRNVFLRDTQTGTTTLISHNNIVGADDHSGGPSLSADGRLVAFASDADNLHDAENDDIADVFVRDTQTGTTTLVSQSDLGAGDDHSHSASISADGRFVAFASEANNLSTGDDDNVTNIFVRDTLAGTTTLVSQGNVGGANDNNSPPSISADGRFVAFASNATNLTGDDNDLFSDVFVRDIQAGTTTLVSHSNLEGADDQSLEPTISANGRFVVFASDADNMSLEDDNAFRNVFRRDVLGPPPQCSDGVQAVAYKRATVIALPCTDDDGDAVTRSIVNAPAHGVLRPVNQAAGTVTYTPAHGYGGRDSFSFRGSDATATGAAATVRLRVAGPLPGRCANRLRGTRRGEVLTGTRAGDRILGRGGNDALDGLRGHDCLSGGSGRDKLSGGSGRDKLAGGRGRDSFNAGAGNDTLNSADGRRERVRCGGGRDRVRADRADRLSGCERVRRV